jgi:hypothetical protein
MRIFISQNQPEPLNFFEVPDSEKTSFRPSKWPQNFEGLKMDSSMSTQRYRPCRSHPMLYGCGCGVFDNINCLMTSVEMMLFFLLLSTIKCSGVPLTHICE